MGIWDKLKRAVSGGDSNAAPVTPEASTDDRLSELLGQGRDKLRKFLLSRSKPSGELKKTKNWALSKTNQGLFRLEGSGFSLVIHTEPFLLKKDGRVTGILRMSEGDLNRAAHDGGTLQGFLSRAEPLPAHSRDLLSELLQGGNVSPVTQEDGAIFDDRPGLEDLRGWSDFDIYQVIIRVSANILAHALIHGSPETESKLRHNLSRRLKSTIVSELEALMSPGSRAELNPHSRAHSLTEFDGALSELRTAMRDHRRNQHRKELRGRA